MVGLRRMLGGWFDEDVGLVCLMRMLEWLVWGGCWGSWFEEEDSLGRMLEWLC